MKLTIRSDIAASLNKILKQEYTGNYHFLFGKKKRAGFSPFINRYEYQCIEEALTEKKYQYTKSTIGKRIFKQICDIGFVTDRHVFLSTIKEKKGNEVVMKIFHAETYEIILLKSQYDYQVEIELSHKPSNLKQMFEPIKFLYSLIQSPVSIEENATEVITMYNALFQRKQNSPWIVPQGLKFLDKKSLILLTDFVIMPIRKGVKYMLYLSRKGAFLISKLEILRIDSDVPESLYDTVIMGDWYEKSFVGYDISVIAGTDIRRKSFLRRIKSLKQVSNLFPFCETVQYYRNNLVQNTEKLLKEHQGIIITPIKANYMNDRVFMYQEVQNVGIKFRIEKSTRCGFVSYALKVGKSNELFKGTSTMPYEHTIPLSRTDREFIEPLGENTIFEFRWESDGLMPYMQVSETSTDKFARRAWSYINNPIDKNTIFDKFKGI
jgi:hypothetical protein